MIIYATIKHDNKKINKIISKLNKKTNKIICKNMTLILKDGSEINVNWDESDWCYGNEETLCRLRGVSFNNEYANEKLEAVQNKIKDIKVTTFDIDNDKKYNSRISYIEFRDYTKTWIFDIEKEEA